MTGQWGRGPLRVIREEFLADGGGRGDGAEAGGGHPGLGAVTGEQRSRRDVGREAEPVRQGLQGHSKSSASPTMRWEVTGGLSKPVTGPGVAARATILPAALCQSFYGTQSSWTRGHLSSRSPSLLTYKVEMKTYKVGLLGGQQDRPYGTLVNAPQALQAPNGALLFHVTTSKALVLHHKTSLGLDLLKP